MYYGIENIPEKWVYSLARKDDIMELINKYQDSLK